MDSSAEMYKSRSPLAAQQSASKTRSTYREAIPAFACLAAAASIPR
jgi:hypothetical protein